MVFNSGVFFSAQVTLQIQAAAGRTIVFGNFMEMTAPRSLLPNVSSVEAESL
jgi:hypothetical protein